MILAVIILCGLVDLQRAIPSLVVDLQYKTSHNITGLPLYPSRARAYALPQMSERLAAVESILEHQGYGLTILDAWRPPEATRRMWNCAVFYGVTEFYAPPRIGSAHNRGAAVDVGLHTLRDPLKLLPMPMAFDTTDFSNADCSREAILNESILRNAMTASGLVRNRLECWHYSLVNEEGYPVVQGPFDAIPEKTNRSLFAKIK